MFLRYRIILAAYAKFSSGPPGGLSLPMTSSRLSDLAGGVYGPGASWASTSSNAHRTPIKASLAQASGETFDEILQYYQYQSDRGKHRYTVALGRMNYIGSIHSGSGGLASGAERVGHVGQDFDKARKYFLKVARILWPHDVILSRGTDLPDGFGAKTGMAELSEDLLADIKPPAAAAAAYLGRMYTRGEGVQRDYYMGRMWLKRGADFVSRGTCRRCWAERYAQHPPADATLI